MADPAKQTRLEDLLSRCALADAAAFDQLYRETSPRLFGVLLRMLKRRDWAEDVLQDTYVRIWREAGSYRPDRGAPLAWMTSIGRYRAIDVMRRYGNDAVLDDADASHAAPDEDAGWRDMASGVDGSALNRCLETLQRTSRAAIVMAYCEGYTHRELSARFAAPLGTVKSWIRRGLESLRECLEA